jgi:hypothetical protein
MPVKKLYCFLWLSDSFDFWNWNGSEISSLSTSVEEILDYIRQEKEMEVLYSQNQLTQIKQDTNQLSESRELLGHFLKIFYEFHKLPPSSNQPCYQWQDGIAKPINGTGLDAIASEFSKAKYNTDNATLVAQGSLPIANCPPTQNFCYIIEDKQDAHHKNQADHLPPRFIKIPLTEGNGSAIRHWSLTKRPRVFQHNRKHPRGGSMPIEPPQASPLLWTAPENNEVQQLLDTAIKDPDHKTLYNWDAKKGHYIAFEDDNTAENTYHAYHLHPNEVERKFRKYPAIKTKLEQLQRTTQP